MSHGERCPLLAQLRVNTSSGSIVNAPERSVKEILCVDRRFFAALRLLSQKCEADRRPVRWRRNAGESGRQHLGCSILRCFNGFDHERRTKRGAVQDFYLQTTEIESSHGDRDRAERSRSVRGAIYRYGRRRWCCVTDRTGCAVAAAGCYKDVKGECPYRQASTRQGCRSGGGLRCSTSRR